MDFGSPNYIPGLVPLSVHNFSANAIYGDIYGSELVQQSDIYNTVPPDQFNTATTDLYDEKYSDVPAKEFEEGQFQEAVVLADGSDQFGVSCLAFDDIQDLLWSGTTGGHITSYLSGEFLKYTSFAVHATEQIRDIRPIERGILVATPTSLSLRARGGQRYFFYECSDFENIQCVLPQSSHRSRVYLGGLQENIIEYDIDRKSIVQLFPAQDGNCVIMRDSHRFVVYGTTKGQIFLHDPRTFRQEKSFKPHVGSLSDFDMKGNYIVTCGHSVRRGQVINDQYMMVYDMRMMKLTTPIRCMFYPYLVRFMPGVESHMCTVSSMGQWTSFDVAETQSAMMSMNYQCSIPHTTTVATLDVSPSGEAVAIGSSTGSIHMFVNASKTTFNNFPIEIVMPTVDENVPLIPITDRTTPLSVIPKPPTTEPLLSTWINKKNIYRPTPPLDPNILQNMRIVGQIGYAPNSDNKKTNVVPYTLKRPRTQVEATVPRKDGRKIFVPHRYRKIELKYNKLTGEDIDFDLYNNSNFCGLDASLPNSYCNAMLQVFYYIEPLRATLMSHLCKREFCLSCELGFLFHMLDLNQDQRNNQGAPCQASNFLRAFRAIPESSAMNLTVLDRDDRSSSNFSYMIQRWNRFTLQQMNYETSDATKDKEISSTLQDLSLTPENETAESSPEREEPSTKTETSPVFDIFGIGGRNIIKCTKCGRQKESDMFSLNIDLQFVEQESVSVSFASVVETSMCLTKVTQAWCDNCCRYQPTEQFKKYTKLPNIMSMNCGLENMQEKKSWQAQHEHVIRAFNNQERKPESKTSEKDSSKNQNPTESPVHWIRPCRYGTTCARADCRFRHPHRESEKCDDSGDLLKIMDDTMQFSWIPLGLKAVIDEDGKVRMQDATEQEIDAELDANESYRNDEATYELISVVSYTADPAYPDKNNLVGCINVGVNYHKRALVSPVSHWYLFNDVSIQPVERREAIWFPFRWKTPCVLYWMRKRMPESLQNLEPVNPITIDVFREDKSLAQRGRKRITFTPLTADEMPGEGDVIAMDAEFVNLHQEEAEIKIDGTKNTIKPSQKSLARITCIRGQGALESIPFLDDYISTQEQVVDYLTKFSGIKPGDLDVTYSQKHLTTLKSTYIKLRYLIDRGVKIIGHGLCNDLRVINIVVPRSQLIDTVHLYRMPHNRMISLKFLAWYFLKVKIQSVTHDSIEDARTALALYHKHEELKSEESFSLELHKLYETGKMLQWKIPGNDHTDINSLV